MAGWTEGTQTENLNSLFRLESGSVWSPVRVLRYLFSVDVDWRAKTTKWPLALGSPLSKHWTWLLRVTLSSWGTSVITEKITTQKKKSIPTLPSTHDKFPTVCSNVMVQSCMLHSAECCTAGCWSHCLDWAHNFLLISSNKLQKNPANTKYSLSSVAKWRILRGEMKIYPSSVIFSRLPSSIQWISERDVSCIIESFELQERLALPVSAGEIIQSSWLRWMMTKSTVSSSIRQLQNKVRLRQSWDNDNKLGGYNSLVSHFNCQTGKLSQSYLACWAAGRCKIYNLQNRLFA